MNRFAALVVLLLIVASDVFAQADMRLTQSASPNPGSAGMDITFTVTVSNAGPQFGTFVVITNPVPAGTTFAWASRDCTHSAGTVSCVVPGVCGLASPGCFRTGNAFPYRFIFRANAAGTVTNNATVTNGVADPDTSNNTTSLAVTVNAVAPGAPVLRYRLFSPVTQEHHFTANLNEYTVLGSYTGTWVQEGTMGRLLDNPGTFNGVTAVPYYRLYHTGQRIHHWTSDPYEYYQLVANGWVGEGVSGYILPTMAAGTTQLYRLHYAPDGRGRHHWTTDFSERTTLLGQGWLEEGGSGFVIQ